MREGPPWRKGPKKQRHSKKQETEKPKPLRGKSGGLNRAPPGTKLPQQPVSRIETQNEPPRRLAQSLERALKSQHQKATFQNRTEATSHTTKDSETSRSESKETTAQIKDPARNSTQVRGNHRAT